MTEEPPNEKTGQPVMDMAGVAVAAMSDPEITVLEDVNWRVEAGDYWVVAGLHGTGKSDLIATAGGLMPPRGGTYRLFGHEMPLYEEELLPERLRVGLVFDGGQLFHRLTVAENLALPLLYHRGRGGRDIEGQVRAMLELTELAPWAGLTPGGLGRNWQKRIGLARALMLEPEVLLVDDPLGGLDSRHTRWWLDFLGRLASGEKQANGRRTTLVVTAEDLRSWRDHASHFAILQQGRLTALGQRSVLAGHSEPLVRELLAERYTEK